MGINLTVSTGGGPVKYVLAANVSAGLGNWSVTVPASAALNFASFVTVWSLLTPSISINSATFFTRAGRCVITAPLAFYRGDNNTISWFAEGPAFVAGSASLTLMAGVTPYFDIPYTGALLSVAAQNFTWTVAPSVATGSYFIRLISSVDALVTCDTGAIAISSGKFTWVSPQPWGTPSLLVKQLPGWGLNLSFVAMGSVLRNSPVSICFTGCGQVAYSSCSYSVSTTTLASAGFYSFFPGTSILSWGAACYTIRITSLYDTTVSAWTTYTQFPVGTLSLVTPLSSASFVQGSMLNITWAYAGYFIAGTSVKIELHPPDGGALVLVTVSPTVTISPATLLWPIPFSLAAPAMYTVKIISVTDVNTFAFSPPFSIVPFVAPSSITVTYPSDVGTVLFVGQSVLIRWTCSGTLTTSTVSIALMSGANLLQNITLSTNAGAGTFSWTVPASLPPAIKLYSFLVSSQINSTIYSSSPLVTVVATPSAGLFITAPASGVVWSTLAPANVSWAGFGSPLVGGTVSLRIIVTGSGAFVSMLGSGLAGVGGTVTFPGTALNGTGALTAGVSYTVLAVCDQDATKTANITIATATSPVYGILAMEPLAGTQALKGSPLSIRWAAVSPAVQGYTVKLELLLSGSVVSTIAASVPVPAGIFSWLVPASTTTAATYSIRATLNEDPTTYSLSPTFAVIPGAFTWTSPKPWGAPTLLVAQLPGWGLNLTWSTEGSLLKTSPVSICFTGCGQVAYSSCSYSVSTTTMASAGFYSFFPGTSILSWGAACYTIRITSLYDTTVSAWTTYTQFPLGVLSIIRPQPFEWWVPGAQANITFSAAGYFIAGTSVRIELWTSSQVTLIATIAATSPVATNSLLWTIPTGNPESNYKVKITSTTDANTFVWSDLIFVSVVPPTFSSTATPTASATATTPSCAAGTFGTLAAGCTACPAGYYCPPGTLLPYTQPCGAGSYCPAGASSPAPCPPQGFIDAAKGPANGPAFDVDTATCYNHCFFGGDGQLSIC